jgi:outer membrane protein TolC
VLVAGALLTPSTVFGISRALGQSVGRPIAAISFAEPVGPGGAAPSPAGSAVGDAPELTVDALVAQVLARNPSLAQMAAAAQAAAARYPQVTSLDDPMFAFTHGPDTFEPDDAGIHFAYRLELSQKYPWPGKLALRGQNAQAEAQAAGNEVEDTRLQLIESATDAFYDYYLVERALEVNAEGLRLLERFIGIARAYVASPPAGRKGSLQDVYQTRVEIGRQNERRLTLERMHQVAVARINTLMDLPPSAPLPPAPKTVQPGDGLPEASALRALALARRPDLQALANHVRAEEAAVALALKEFYPDFEPFVMYDRFMGNNETNADLATMVGVRLNLPCRRDKRCAAVAEARARVAQRRAELARQVDEVNFQVEQAYAKVRESEAAVGLYQKSILPDARLNVNTARTDYEAGLIPALSYIEAERSYVDLQDRSYEVVAEYFRRQAALERAVGVALVAPAPVRPTPPLLPR